MAGEAASRLSLDDVRFWKMSGHGTSACFSAWTWDRSLGRGARVLVRRKAGESVQDLMSRGLTELTRRLQDGMPVRNVMSRAQFERAWKG